MSNRKEIPTLKEDTRQKPIINIMLTGKISKALPFKKGNETGCLAPFLLLNIVLEVLAMTIRQEKDVRVKKEEKRVLFTDEKTMFIEQKKKKTT